MFKRLVNKGKWKFYKKITNTFDTIIEPSNIVRIKTNIVNAVFTRCLPHGSGTYS